ncbi:MAG TPA: hypothetical protein VFP24_00850 [Gaiellaceae bacterium]|nr:hypothetical protein [Gaiellaceae bacterium]
MAPEAAAPVAPPAEAPAAPALGVADMRDVPLGTLVFRAGLLPEEKLEEALQEGIKSGKRLGEILLERGLVSESDLGHLLAGQKGLPFVDLDPTAIDPTAPPLLHPEKARLHGALPIGFEGGVPVVAVADPSNDLVVENVRRALNCEPVLVVAGRDALYRAIDASYGGQPAEAPVAATAPLEPHAQVPTVPAVPAVEAHAPVPEPAAVVAAPEPVAPAPPVVEPVAPVAEPAVPAVPEPVAVELPAPEPAVPVAEPVAPVAEPVAPVAEPVPAAPVLPVAPVATQPSTNGEGLWLGEAQEATPPQVVAPQPAEPAPEPIQNVQVIEHTPVLQAESLEAPAVPAVVPEPQSEPVAAAEPVATPTPSWAVELRLVNGERIEVGVHSSNEEALDAARAVVAHASIEGSWPYVDGRFLRPEAILSVDLVELADDRWLGSSARAAWGDQS